MLKLDEFYGTSKDVLNPWFELRKEWKAKVAIASQNHFWQFWKENQILSSYPVVATCKDLSIHSSISYYCRTEIDKARQISL